MVINLCSGKTYHKIRTKIVWVKGLKTPTHDHPNKENRQRGSDKFSIRKFNTLFI